MPTRSTSAGIVPLQWPPWAAVAPDFIHQPIRTTMHHGWNDDDYLILFTSEESAPMTAAYAIRQYLPDFTLIGLRSWDEFIVANPDGTLLTVPTVPLDLHHAVAFALPERLTLEPDLGFEGKIKWYVKPLVFGGDATDTANTIWIAHEQHAELVRWWNEQYLALKGSKPSYY